MILKNVKLENYTVFEKHQLAFCSGINIFIGENGTGKTHILKLLYSACQSVDSKISFPQKIVSTMLPDNYKISRLITRQQGNHSASVKIVGCGAEPLKEKALMLKFHGKTKKWDGEVIGEDGWEEAFHDVSSVFIPAKEILSHSYNLNAASEKNNVRFDDTYLDIINAAKIDISVGRNSEQKNSMLELIERMTHGTVYYDVKKDEFYLKSGNSKQEFNLVAEGIRKMALLWQLVKNGTLENGSILFWDEPEANINPSNVEIIIEMLLQLQRKGVQIFISTHNYLLASYFDVKRKDGDKILFHSFSLKSEENKKPGQTETVHYEVNEKFSDIKNNAIITAYNRLLDEIYFSEGGRNA